MGVISAPAMKTGGLVVQTSTVHVNNIMGPCPGDVAARNFTNEAVIRWLESQISLFKAGSVDVLGGDVAGFMIGMLHSNGSNTPVGEILDFANDDGTTSPARKVARIGSSPFSSPKDGPNSAILESLEPISEVQDPCWEDLPTELLIKILGYVKGSDLGGLISASSVNKEWRASALQCGVTMCMHMPAGEVSSALSWLNSRTSNSTIVIDKAGHAYSQSIKKIGEFLSNTKCIDEVKISTLFDSEDGFFSLMEGLRTCSAKSLIFSACEINEEEMGAAMEAIRENKNLEHVEFSSSELLAVTFAHRLSGILESNSNIKELSLFDAALEDENICELFNAMCDSYSAPNKPSAVSTVNLWSNEVRFGSARAMKKLLCTPKNCLTELNLSSCDIDCDVLVEIAEGLRSPHCKLESLNLNTNNIGDDGAGALFQSLMANKSLQSLHLSFNELGEESLVKLANLLDRNATLRHLDLTQCNIMPEGLALIAEKIQKSNIEELYLSSNGLSVNAAPYVARLLDSKRLRVLDLSCNSLGKNGLAILSPHLRENRVLIELRLTHAKLNDEAAEVLCDSVQDNKSLQKLDIRGNNIELRGARAVAGLIRSNRSLRTLLLAGNVGVGHEGLVHIIRALHDNDGLVTLNVSHLGAKDNSIKAAVVVGDLLTNVYNVKSVCGCLETLLPGASDRWSHETAAAVSYASESNTSLRRLLL